jgi:O-antigen ligase
VQTAFLNLRVDHAHCDDLEVASELGLPGILLVFGSILWIFAKAVYALAGSLNGCVGSILAILAHSLGDFNLYIPGNALVFCVVLALAWSTAHGRGSPVGSSVA